MRISKILTSLALTALLSLAAAGVALASEVAQGKCTDYNKDSGTLTIEEYDLNFSKENPYGKSTGVLSVFDAKDAKIGISPAPGDVLRISYKPEGTGKQALKVMNVSKQDLRKK